MSTNRIQKLLFSEYCDFEDIVLVESPFAETSREGVGVRQVSLGLTPSKLVIATDILPMAKDSAILFMPGLDPEIETLELVAVYPVDCVNLSVFHRRKRQALKARFCNNKVMYFELGGFEKRNMFWNLWCEKIRFLNPNDANCSHSETSVATSTSNSTLYLVASKKNNQSHIWSQYGGGDFVRSDPPKWQDKHLFLGSNLHESPLKYTPVQALPLEEDFLKKTALNNAQRHQKQSLFSIPTQNTHQPLKPSSIINRFSSGVQENCNNGLYLPRDDPKKNYVDVSNTTCNIPLDTTSSNMFVDENCLHNLIHNQPYNFVELANSAVRLWELQTSSTSISSRARHRRRYALAPHPHFYRGLGPWNVNQGERFTLQMKRAVSMVCIKRQPLEPELRLSLSRRQLIASISYENLQEDKKFSNCNIIRNSHKTPVILFWTPEYWYRPQSARETYRELQAHLRKIHEYHQLRNSKQLWTLCIFKTINKPEDSRMKSGGEEQIFLTKDENTVVNCQKCQITSLATNFIHISFKRSMQSISSVSTTFDYENTSSRSCLRKIRKRISEVPIPETSVQLLKRMLRMEIALSAWDFDSNVLALQLTLIDKDLFLKIIPEEFSILLWQQSSKNASNIGALIAFSHRISCLVCSEILKDDTEKIRARMITRFINVAEKCNSLNNFQSCKSVLSGLQSPPVYRLHSTWNYIRKRHSSKYEVFETLCRQYRDARLPTYQNSFQRAAKSPAYMPFIGDIIAKLLDIVSPSDCTDLNIDATTNSTKSSNLGLKISVKRNKENSETSVHKLKIEQTQSLFKKIISTLRVWHADEKINKTQSGIVSAHTKKKQMTTYKSTAEHYKELYFYEDNRQERLRECMALLIHHQNAAAKYNYKPNELAREYLLKARYKEDQDNFMRSFVVEPNILLGT